MAIFEVSCCACRLPSGNITVIAMPRTGSSARHLISYIRQDPLWDAMLDGSPTWPDCVWTTKIKPYSGRVSQLMLEYPNSTIGFQPVGHYLTIRILTRMAEAQAVDPQHAYAVQTPLASGNASHPRLLLRLNLPPPAQASLVLTSRNADSGASGSLAGVI